jgi:hypothetical protein
MVRPSSADLKVDVGEKIVIAEETDERNSPELRRIHIVRAREAFPVAAVHVTQSVWFGAIAVAGTGSKTCRTSCCGADTVKDRVSASGIVLATKSTPFTFA